MKDSLFTKLRRGVGRCLEDSPSAKVSALLAVSFVVLALLVSTLSSFPNGVIPQSDSVLSSQTPCFASGCHAAAPATPFNQGGSVALGGLPASFTPGSVHDLSVTITGGPAQRFGVQIISVYSDNTQAGTLTSLTNNVTKKTYPGGVEYLSHATPLPSNMNVINFRWTAPDQPKGTVFFKFAANSANGDGTNAGDSIFFGTATTEPQQAPVPSAALIFPQFVNGVVNQLPNRSRFVGRNNHSQALSGRIKFKGPSGNPVSVPVNGQMVDTIEFNLDPWGVLDISTDGTGDLQFGVVEVFVDSGEASTFSGTEIFSLLGNFVSVNNSPARKSQQIFVSVNSEESTGFAAYNPDSQMTITLQLILLNDKGQEVARKNITLNPMQQLARFVEEAELFKDFFDANPGTFKGTLNISVVEADKKASILGLIQRRSNGALLSVPTSSNAFTSSSGGSGGGGGGDSGSDDGYN